MSLKSKFLNYCELARCARNIRDTEGPMSKKTADAYERANVVKRDILDELDELDV